MAVIGSIAACVISVILLLSSKSGIRKTKEPPAQQTHAAQPSPASPRPIDHLGASVPKKENAGRTSATTDSDAEDRGFVTLSPYDSAVSASDLAIVRMELTGTDLRLLGAPVTEDLSDQHLLADVIVSGDGTPYAVRIVR